MTVLRLTRDYMIEGLGYEEAVRRAVEQALLEHRLSPPQRLRYEIAELRRQEEYDAKSKKNLS